MRDMPMNVSPARNEFHPRLVLFADKELRAQTAVRPEDGNEHGADHVLAAFAFVT
jgi:hypothetical protein